MKPSINFVVAGINLASAAAMFYIAARLFQAAKA
jgi:hypothetical protein